MFRPLTQRKKMSKVWLICMTFMTEWTDESPSADPSHLLILPPLPKCQNKAIHEPPAWIFVAPVISAHVCISRVSHVGKLMIRRYCLLHLLRAKSTHWTKKKEKKSELSEAARILWSKNESNTALLWFGFVFFLSWIQSLNSCKFGCAFLQH